MKNLGQLPSRSDALITDVIGVMRISKNSITRNVDQGSSEQDLLGEFLMILATGSSVTEEKAEKTGGVRSESVYLGGLEFAKD